MCTKAVGIPDVWTGVQSEGCSSRRWDTGRCLVVWTSMRTLGPWEGTRTPEHQVWGRSDSELWPILSPDETCPAPTPPHRGHEQQLRAPTRSHLLVDLGTFPPTCSWEAHSHSGMQPARGLCSTVLLGRSLRQSKSYVQRRERNLRSTLPALIWGCGGKVVSFVSNRPGLIPTFATPAWAASGSLPHLSE